MRMLEWAQGKFQDAYESVHSGNTEWVCECLSWHTASFRMPESVRSGHTEWVCECLSGQVPQRGSEWCHVDAARDYAVAQQWCSSSSAVGVHK